MRDVIVIGAGGGGPVVAKELAARGLRVLLLEAGARHADPRGEWTHFENDANNPLTGFLRFGPADRTRPAWFRELPQNSFLFQVAGVGGTTQHYFGNCPRAYPGVFAGYEGPDAAAYDTAHRFPFLCLQGCIEPLHAPRNRFAKRSTDNSYVPMAPTADAWSPGGVPVTLISDAFATRIVLSALPADEHGPVRRLFIADNSALANALGGPNPTLTSQALATRTAERIFQRYFGGAPWVARGL